MKARKNILKIILAAARVLNRHDGMHSGRNRRSMNLGPSAAHTIGRPRERRRAKPGASAHNR